MVQSLLHAPERRLLQLVMLHNGLRARKSSAENCTQSPTALYAHLITDCLGTTMLLCVLTC